LDLFTLSDLLLSYYSQTQSSTSLRYEEKENIQLNYPAIRSKIILPFVSEKKNDLAFQLAEKYQDFKILASLLVDTDKEKLLFYMQKYRVDQFPSFLFELLLQTGKYEELFSYFDLGYQPELEHALAPYPHLKWILNIQQSNYLESSNVLHNLATTETRELIARKTWASLSKLACLVSITHATSINEQQISTGTLLNTSN
jgi:hypothetical protein